MKTCNCMYGAGDPRCCLNQGRSRIREAPFWAEASADTTPLRPTPPERTGQLWARLYAAIGNDDSTDLAAIRAEFGSASALRKALMEDVSNA